MNHPLGFRPQLVCEVEVSDPDALVVHSAQAYSMYDQAYCLVRCHGTPIGIFRGLLSEDAKSSISEFSKEMMETFSEQIRCHMKSDSESSLAVNGGSTACSRDLNESDEHPIHLDVIVPTRDRPASVRRCIEQLLDSTYPSEALTITIVDNVPTSDLTREVVRSFREVGNVRYLRSDVPGSASARNTGISGTQGEVVLFTDDDVVVDRGWVRAMVAPFRERPDVGCVTGLILPLELETQAQVWFEEYGGFGKGLEPVSWSLRHPPSRDPLFPFAVGKFGSGNSMAFRRSTLEAVGGFDALLGNGTPTLGGVDVEMFLRVVTSGYTLVYEPRAVLWHQHRRDYTDLRKQVYAYGVGLTAVLLRTAIHRPDLVGGLLRKVPRGMYYAVSSRSEKHNGKSGSYPRQLRRLELRGMARGPFAYLESVLGSRKTRDGGRSRFDLRRRPT